MTHATDRLEDDINPGQQDDYFDEDLAIAGHAPKSSPVPADLQNQGQQDDYFDEDLAASNRPPQPDSEGEAASW